MKVSAALPTGVTALLFDAARRRRALEGRLASRLQEAGYSEVILPIVDYLEPYEPFLTAKSRRELYRLVDRDGEPLALRADFTPMLARLLAPRLPALELPLRVFYRGDVVRYQEERAGRQREFYQVGAELLGLDEEAADPEILRLFLEVLAAGEARPVQVVLSFAGALDRLLRETEGDPAELATATHRRDRSVVGRLSPALLQVVEQGAPDDPAVLGPEAAERLLRLQALAEELGREVPDVRVTVDLAEFAHQVLDPDLLSAIGDRAYYDGIVFRSYVGGRGLPIGAGGRYNRLFRQLGADVPAIGFSIGLERLLAPAAAPDRPAGGAP
jgi:ATP phosphoribosyltransferase regulatory subunit